MVMKEHGTDNLLTFSTSSFGGRGALAKLCKEFDRNYRQHEGAWPVVQLGCDAYDHDVYGEIQKPVFKIVAWAHWDDSLKRLAVTVDDPRTQVKNELGNDEIPF
jgi:hypothetical protein